MKVEIWSDIVCPWCYIGKARFEKALERFPHRDEVEVVYRSFELDPTIPVGETRDVVADLAAKKGVSEQQVIQLMTSVEAIAAEDGLEFHLRDARAGNTVRVHQLLHLAADEGRQEELLSRLYRAHFTELRSLFDTDTLVGLAVEVGLDRDAVTGALEDPTYEQRVRDDEAVARSLGIRGVPFFVIDRKYGISGAQPPESLLDALEQAWREANPIRVTAGGGVCEDGVCY